jgi:hypothetical protein
MELVTRAFIEQPVCTHSRGKRRHGVFSIYQTRETLERWGRRDRNDSVPTGHDDPATLLPRQAARRSRGWARPGAWMVRADVNFWHANIAG